MDFKRGFSAVYIGEQIDNIIPTEGELLWFYKESQSDNVRITESENQGMYEEQAIVPKKKKNTKKLKKINFDHEGLSPFAQWLLSQKSISGDEIAITGKAKSNKIKETAKKSIKASEDIISEPLAVILMKQGHYLESKKMFQKLAYKFPDKADEYLRFISDINDLIDNKL